MFHLYGTYLGENTSPWLEIIAGFVGVLVAAITSFLIFYLERKNEKLREADRLNEIEKYVKDSIPLLCDRVDAHLKSIQDIELRLSKKQTPENLNFELTTSLHGRTLSWLSKTDLFTIYVRKKKYHKKDRILYLSKLNNQLDYLESANELWVKMMDDTLRVNFNNYLNKYNDNFFELISNCQRLIVKARSGQHSFDRETLVMIIEIDKIIGNYQNTENFKDHYVTAERLFTPLLKCCGTYRKNGTALEIILMVNKTMVWFENMDALKTSVLNVITHTKKKMRLTKIELNRFLQLSEHTSKKPWRRRTTN